MADPDARLATAKREAVLAAVLTTLLAGLVSAGFILKMVRRPVRQLISGTARVAGGDLDTEIRVDSHDEIGELAEAFNRMTRDLRETRRALTEWSGAVEAKLQEKTSELSRTQRHVAHMDKMASLGKLSATVAHELNNPLAGILNYAKLVMRGLETQPLDPAERRDLYRYLGVIQKEADRCGKIVRNMLLVARPTAGAFVPNSLNRIIDRSVMLVGHHLEISNVQLAIQGIGADDELVCDADGIQQALVALLINAVESMPDGGMIRLSAEREGEGVRLTISDTGCGIPMEALPHIFEPFFSTKTGASGLGLGLSVVYGIVEQHQGTIDVESNVNEGTTFRVLLPNRPPGDEAVAEASASTGPGITGGG